MVQAVLAGEPVRAVAQRWQTDRKIVRKWLLRYRREAKRVFVTAARARIARHGRLHVARCNG
jgi:hypothetical protein